MATKGILLCAWSKVCYGYAAFNFAASIKHLSPNVPITLLCDAHAIRDYNWQHKTVFDDIIVMGDEVADPGLFKVSIYERLPYDYTLFLDVDALAINPVDKLLDRLIADFESDGSKFYRTHVHGWYNHASPDDMPMMYWATRGVIWDQYGFDHTHRLPGTQSSIQFIAKCDRAEKFFTDLKDLMKNKYIPLELLKNRWGGTQPDELYLNIQIAKDHLTPDIEGAMWFCDNSEKRPGVLIEEGYVFLSYFGVRERIKGYFIDWYDREPVRFLRKLGFANHHWKSSALFQSKHAANKVKPITRTIVEPVTDNKVFDAEVFQSKPTKRISVFTTYYKAKSGSRQAELIECIHKNLDHPDIDRVVIASECDVPVAHPKLVVVPSPRLTMKGLVDLANTMTDSDDVNVLCNTDIYMDQGISMVKDFNMYKTVLCLSRWDRTGTGALRYIDAEYSQDAWVWEGRLDFNGGDYNFGLLGCDNKFAYDVNQSGYTVHNPSRHIKTVHLHLTNERSYSERTRLPRPYLNVKVGGITELNKRRLLLNQPGKVGDIIRVMPIAKYWADKGYTVDWLCPIEYHDMFAYFNYAKPITVANGVYQKEIDLSFGLNTKSAAHAIWIKRKKKLDSFVTLKYELSEVPLTEMDRLNYNRNFKNEQDLFDHFNSADGSDYVIVHSGSDYGTPIYIATNKRVVKFEKVGAFTIFDWRQLIEKASEIHCIDSSLANFVDAVGTTAELFYYKTDKVPMKADETLLTKNWTRINIMEYANS